MAVLRPKSSLKAGLQTRISRVFTVCSSRFSVLFGQNENCWASSGLYRNFAPPEQLAEQSPAGMRIIDWGRMAPRSFTQSNPRLGRGARCARFHCVCFFYGAQAGSCFVYALQGKRSWSSILLPMFSHDCFNCFYPFRVPVLYNSFTSPDWRPYSK